MAAQSRLGPALAAIGFGFACAAHPVATPTRPTATTKPHFVGRVLREDGRPAAGAVIVVTDPIKGDVLSMVRATQDGTFATSLQRGIYGVTATDAEQSVYLPSADGKSRLVDVRLDANCHRFEGRIRTESRLPQGSVIQLRRVSNLAGDIFGAALDEDGTFRACVPAAMYGIRPPDGFVTRNVYVEIPFARKFEYRTEPRQVTDRIPTDMSGITPDSLDAFVDTFPATTKVLGLGESNHGTREFYEERTALTKRLAESHGFRLLILEAGYGETLALDDYVNGANIDVERAVQELGYWIYDTKTFLQTLAEIRAYNAPLAANKRIHIMGIDVQNTTGVIKQLRQPGTGLSPSESASLEKFVADRGKAWTTLTPAERTVFRAALGRVAATPRNGGVSSKVNRTVLAAKSLLFRFDMWEATDVSELANTRDAAMARMVLDVLAGEPQARATLWAHLAHVAREYSVDAGTMGAHLAAALGDSYHVYALLALAGSARAWDRKQEVGVIASTLQAPPEYGLEAVLAARSAGAPITYWTFARATGEAVRWLKGMHALRTFGSAFMGPLEIEYWNLRAFDGVILFQSVSPTVPTPTGERHATPKPQ